MVIDNAHLVSTQQSRRVISTLLCPHGSWVGQKLKSRHRNQLTITFEQVVNFFAFFRGVIKLTKQLLERDEESDGPRRDQPKIDLKAIGCPRPPLRTSVGQNTSGTSTPMSKVTVASGISEM